MAQALPGYIHIGWAVISHLKRKKTLVFLFRNNSAGQCFVIDLDSHDKVTAGTSGERVDPQASMSLTQAGGI